MSVMLPSSASIGGGGVCLVHWSKDRKTEALTFLTKLPAGGSPGTVPVGVPGNVRGMAALHARYGVLRWEQLVAPAERMARLGAPVSRAMARDLSGAAAVIQQDPVTRRAFSQGNGQLIVEGSPWIQDDLAGSLGSIRLRGAGELYVGSLARQFVDAVRAGSGIISVDDMRGQTPVWSEAVTLPFGDHVAYFAPPPTGGGILTAEIWTMLQRQRYDGVSADQRPALLTEITRRAYADRSYWTDGSDQVREDPRAILTVQRIDQLMAGYAPDRASPAGSLSRPPQPRPNDAPGASLVVVDRFANAVVCAFTTNGFFGGGRIAGSTGILLSPAPGVGGHGSPAIGPMMIANPNTGDFVFAGSASGGTSGPAMLAAVAANTMLLNQSLAAALQAPRALHPGVPDKVFAEPSIAGPLRARGDTVEELQSLGQVNAIVCPRGLREQSKSCEVGTDPRGFGLGLSAPPTR
jgi:gamma-glutamyltranspeptidase/glutathione hydrolase